MDQWNCKVGKSAQERKVRAWDVIDPAALPVDAKKICKLVLLKKRITWNDVIKFNNVLTTDSGSDIHDLDFVEYFQP